MARTPTPPLTDHDPRGPAISEICRPARAIFSVSMLIRDHDGRHRLRPVLVKRGVSAGDSDGDAWTDGWSDDSGMTRRDDQGFGALRSSSAWEPGCHRAAGGLTCSPALPRRSAVDRG